MKDRHYDSAHQSFLVALLLAFQSVFFCYVAYDLGILKPMLAADSTYISVIIIVLFALTLCHSLWRGWVLSDQAEKLSKIQDKAGHDQLHAPVFAQKVSYAQDYLLANVSSRESDGKEPIPKASNEHQSAMAIDAEVLAERLRGPNQIGWFSAGLMIKFGLLGTVIGFAIMLGSINSLNAQDVDDIRGLMQQMTQGMRIAMNTTILGLIFSSLIGVQYLLLDRFSDSLIIRILADREG